MRNTDDAKFKSAAGLQNWSFFKWKLFTLQFQLHNLQTATSIIKAGKALAAVTGRDVSDSDVNGDGVVDASELAAMLGERATADDVTDFLRFVDEDGECTWRQSRSLPLLRLTSHPGSSYLPWCCVLYLWKWLGRVELSRQRKHFSIEVRLILLAEWSRLSKTGTAVSSYYRTLFSGNWAKFLSTSP